MSLAKMATPNSPEESLSHLALLQFQQSNADFIARMRDQSRPNERDHQRDQELQQAHEEVKYTRSKVEQMQRKFAIAEQDLDQAKQELEQAEENLERVSSKRHEEISQELQDNLREQRNLFRNMTAEQTFESGKIVSTVAEKSHKHVTSIDPNEDWGVCVCLYNSDGQRYVSYKHLWTDPLT